MALLVICPQCNVAWGLNRMVRGICPRCTSKNGEAKAVDEAATNLADDLVRGTNDRVK